MEAGPVVSRKVKVWPCLHSVPNYPAGAVVAEFLATRALVDALLSFCKSKGQLGQQHDMLFFCLSIDALM